MYACKFIYVNVRCDYLYMQDMYVYTQGNYAWIYP